MGGGQSGGAAPGQYPTTPSTGTTYTDANGQVHTGGSSVSDQAKTDDVTQLGRVKAGDVATVTAPPAGGRKRYSAGGFDYWEPAGGGNWVRVKAG